MYRTFLSLRYLRARRVNWIGTAGIAVAVTALILILSIMSGFLGESRGIVRSSLSDLIVQPMLDRPIGLKPRDRSPDAMLEAIRAHPGVEAAAAQYQWVGMLAQNGRSYRASLPGGVGFTALKLVGIDYEDEAKATELRAALSPDANRSNSPYPVEWVEDIDDPFAMPSNYDPEERGTRPLDRVLIGAQLSTQFSLHRGDVIELVTTTYDPDTGEVAPPSNRRFVVAGAFRTGENEMDISRVYLERDVLSDLLGEEDGYTTVVVKLKDYEGEADTVVAELASELFEQGLLDDPGWGEMRTWEQFKEGWLKAVENEKSLMGVMLSLVMIVAGFTIFAQLSMMVTEKRRDIGIICALGGNTPGILTMFLLIGFWQATFGAVIGALLGIVGALKIDRIERWLSDTFGFEIFDRDVYYFDHIPSEVEPFGVAMIVLGAYACALVFAVFPAWKAARLNPIDALRYE